MALAVEHGLQVTGNTRVRGCLHTLAAVVPCLPSIAHIKLVRICSCIISILLTQAFS